MKLLNVIALFQGHPQNQRVSSPLAGKGLSVPVKRLLTCGLLTLCFGLLACVAQAQTTLEAHAHEYAELHAAEISIQDFTFKTLEGEKLNLRTLAAGKQLMLIHYFAAWCHNSNYDVETIKELYTKYKEHGLAVIAVCEYSKPKELREFIKKYQPAYPVVLESEKLKDREKTTHYAYRIAAQDKREWGTPFNVLLSASDFSAMGQIVATRAQVAFGELMKSEVESYIRQQLKLP